MNEISLSRLGTSGKIIEGIVTTENADSTINIAAMGPLVDDRFTTLVIRPFKTSSTYANLIRSNAGVFHVTDDVELFAKVSLGQVPEQKFLPAEPLVLESCCRWYRFAIDSTDDSQERATLIATVTAQGTIRDFVGFNRAKNAVIEAAILATRLRFLDLYEVQTQFATLCTIVEKTGGIQETKAFELLAERLAEVSRKRLMELPTG